MNVAVCARLQAAGFLTSSCACAMPPHRAQQNDDDNLDSTMALLDSIIRSSCQAQSVTERPWQGEPAKSSCAGEGRLTSLRSHRAWLVYRCQGRFTRSALRDVHHLSMMLFTCSQGWKALVL